MTHDSANVSTRIVYKKVNRLYTVTEALCYSDTSIYALRINIGYKYASDTIPIRQLAYS